MIVYFIHIHYLLSKRLNLREIGFSIRGWVHKESAKGTWQSRMTDILYEIIL